MTRRRGLKGHDYVTVVRPTSDRDRHGDFSEGYTTHREGPCMIAWATAWASVKEVVGWPIEATDRDITLIFKHQPDIDQKDFVELGNRTQYRVVAVEPWRFGGDGRHAGTVIRLSGIEQGD